MAIDKYIAAIYNITMSEDFEDNLAFQRDSGNSDKNLLKHRVSNDECEQVFIDPDKIIIPDTQHSGPENRYIIIGKTKQGRTLFVVFTIRNKLIRVISARDLNREERNKYL